MKRHNLQTLVGVVVLSAVALALSQPAFAQNVKTDGLITGRSGDQIILKTANNPEQIVVLTQNTDVAQTQGPFKARRKSMSMAALIPGLAIKVEGDTNDLKQITATKIRFSGKDLRQAQSIEAGMHETQAQTMKNQQELEKQNAALQQQNEALKAQQELTASQQLELQKHKEAIDAAVARFGQLDDYYIMDEVTVLFPNGKAKVPAKYVPDLKQLADKAKDIKGYMVEVKGYASAVGPAEFNQRLSSDRANNVTAILLQQGKVPLTRMLAPGAMGESDQIGSDRTREGQAENRRVVVRILQNKAISGVTASASAGPSS
jgi:OmpA-OmpF porin, OOP family